jgi:hypothetical protein
LVGRSAVRYPATASERGLEPFDVRTDPRTSLGCPVGRILMVKTKQKIGIKFIDNYFEKKSLKNANEIVFMRQRE